MSYKGRKVAFIFFACLFGMMTMISIIVLASGNGPIALLFVFGIPFVFFLILGIYFRNLDQHYWPPKDFEPLQVSNTDIVALDIYRKIKKNFPELPLNKAFPINNQLFDKLHIECRRNTPTQLTIQLVVNEMWSHMGLSTSAPNVYLTINDSTSVGLPGLSTNNVAGLASTDYKERSLLVNYNKGYNVDSLICLLSHELSHFYQFDTHKIFTGIYAEYVTDAMTAFFGFSNSFLYGRNYSYYERVGINGGITTKGKLGYIGDINYKKILWLIKQNAKMPFDSEDVNKKVILQKFQTFQASFEMNKRIASLNANTSSFLGNYKEVGTEYKDFLESIPLEELKNNVNELINNYSKELFDKLLSVFVINEILCQRNHRSTD